MDSFIDIYSKLIIAIISFIAPLIVYMLSVFSNGTAVIKKRAAEEKRQIGQLIAGEVATGGNFSSEMVDKSNKALKNSEKRIVRRLNLLNPGRQIVRIFSPLFLALFFIMLNMLFKDVNFLWCNFTVSNICGALSGLSFVVGLFILKQVAWAVIDTKRIIAEDASAETVRTIEENK